MTIYERPDEKTFASAAKTDEVKPFPDIERGMGIYFDINGGYPEMKSFNGLHQGISEALRYFMQRGLSEWSETEDYPAGAYVQHKNHTWKAVEPNSKKEPDIDSVWVKWALTLPEITSLISDVGNNKLDKSANLGDLTSVASAITNLRLSDVYVQLSQMSSATDSDSEETVATSKAVKAAFDAISSILKAVYPAWSPLPCPFETAPKGFLKCNGAAFDTNLYPELATGYPSGFLPDLRGEFIRGWDDGRGVDVGRLILSLQLDMFKAHIHTYQNNSYGVSAAPSTGAQLNNGTVNRETGSAGGSETRPRNVAFLFVVRAA